MSGNWTIRGVKPRTRESLLHLAAMRSTTLAKVLEELAELGWEKYKKVKLTPKIDKKINKISRRYQ